MDSAIQGVYSFPISWLGGIYLVFTGVYFFLVLYLYKFSHATPIALEGKNRGDLKFAFLNLKSHYRFMGILVIIILSLYALIFTGAIVLDASGAL